MFEDKLKSVCDRFYVDAERMETYGKNCAAEEYGGVNSRLVSAAKAVRMARGAISNIRRVSQTDTGLGRVLADEMYLIGATAEGFAALKKTSLPGRRGAYPAVAGLAMSLARAGDACASPEALKGFIAGVEKYRCLDIAEAQAFCDFVRLGIIIYLGELSARALALPRVLTEADAKIKNMLSSGAAPSAFDRRTAGANRELSRGLEEQARIYLRTLRRYREKSLYSVPEKYAACEMLLCNDPAGVYPASTDRTRGYIKMLISTEARCTRVSERELIENLISKSDTDRGVIGQVFALPKIEKRRKLGRFVRLVLENILPAIGGIVTGMYGNILSGAVAYPIWRDMFLSVINFLFPNFVLPREMCQLELAEGVPDEFATVCVISLLADSPKTVSAHVEKLRRYYLSNRDCKNGVRYALLMDLTDADEAELPTDGEILRAAESGVKALNESYGQRFCAIVRKREYSQSEQKYIAPERKRGAIVALSALLCGSESACTVLGTGAEQLNGLKYILTLDADTEPYPGSIKALIATAAHPQNRPEISSGGRVVSGYGIIKPRIGVELKSANTSLFSRIFAGGGGNDRYSSSLADSIWCQFGVSFFTGKGIIDAGAMNLVLGDKLPRGKILSHDILEGGALRCGYAHSIEFSDGFPSTVRGFYKRLGRWTRGDVQLLPWVKATVKNAADRPCANPVNAMTRYEIAKNALRAIEPGCVLLSLFMFVTGFQGWWIGVLAGALNLCIQLIFNIVLRVRCPKGIILRRHSDVYTGWRGGVMLTFSRFVFLPFEAWVAFRAAVTSLWRMLVTKKRMLEWVTAAEGDRLSPKGALKTYFSMIACVVVGALAVIVGMDTGSLAIAVIWCLAPLYASYLSVPIEEKRAVRDAEKSLLKDHAVKMARYFSDQDKSGYLLPPDNYQEMPYIGWADRTSPTNIGLCLLSAVSLAELGIIDREEAVLRCEKLCTAVEGLEKYRGNLYNWYSCSNAVPLPPRHISSVDSGNFVACVGASAAALEAWGSDSAKKLASRLDRLWREADLSVFYDSENKLMSIGLDGEKRRLGGHYDMLASEARLTSYVAIAKGDIPAESWGALSRLTVKQRGYSGLAAWSGSLFEYLMPDILLPVVKNSLLYESGVFAVHSQKHRGDVLGQPWGVSECCYMGFDSAMNYQYKAHGDPNLAIGNMDGSEYALSPYSSYLALGRCPGKAVANLEKCAELGLFGSYGMCEAADFTAGRIPPDTDFMPVQTYMTHHIGMSLCSVANLLCDRVLVKHFMSVPEFSAAEQLLCERIPEQCVKPKRKYAQRRREPHKKFIFPEIQYKAWGSNPPIALLSNLELTSVLNAEGKSKAIVSGKDMYRSDIGVVTAVKYGESCEFIKAECQNRTFGIFADRGVYGLDMDGIRVRETVSVSKSGCAERRSIDIDPSCGGEMLLAVYLEPQLCSDKKYLSHPEFERLKLRADAVNGENAVMIRRRDSEKGDLCMCVAWSGEADVTLSRSLALGRGGTENPGNLFLPWENQKSSDGDPCVLLGYKLKLTPNKKIGVALAFSVSNEPKRALELAQNAIVSERRASAYMSAVSALELNSEAVELGCRLAGAVLGWNSQCRQRGDTQSVPKQELWKLKISGDIPLSVISSENFISESEFMRDVYLYIRLHRVLSLLGLKFDLAILCDDGGSYERPSFNGVGVAVKLAGSSNVLNADGGIHIVDRGSADLYGVKALETYGISLPVKNCEKSMQKLPWAPLGASGPLADRIHSIPLANKGFGSVMADIGPVLIYSRNSRLLRLIPWQNDSLAPRALGFELGAVVEGKIYSLFAANDGMKSVVTFAPGVAIWEREICGCSFTTTAFADPRLPCLTFNIEARGQSLPEIIWNMAPCICENLWDRGTAVMQYSDGVFTAQNPVDITGTKLYAMWSREPKFADSKSFRAVLDLGKEKSSLALCISTEEGAAIVGAQFSKENCISAAKSFAFDSVEINTGLSRIDEYINRWSEYQIRISRLCAKASAFQNGGATGFRDQLQDTASLLLTDSDLLKEQILKCCAHQYEAGDVMHWFHEGAESYRRGVRTRCSDDLLWLPRETAEYVLATADLEILNTRVIYLKSEPLKENEKDRYEEIVYSNTCEPVFDHCVRAVECFLSRGFDGRGLPRILDGDWNDGFSKVGEKGQGVSVWLAFFAAGTLEMFSKLCELVKRSDSAKRYSEISQRLVKATEKAWDGDRFARAWTDSDMPLGTKSSPVFSIDSIAQSFAWFVSSPNPDFAVKRANALETALKLLREPNHGIWKLFDRPVTDQSLGYIADYPAGVRENGGQYTHGAMWLAAACFKSGKPEAGVGILQDVINAGFSSGYGGEAFVIAADVSSRGKCGWSWYTGSAGWFRRVVFEEWLGIRLEMGNLRVVPNLPPDMEGYTCRVRVNGCECHIKVTRTGERKDGLAELSGQKEVFIDVTV